jgi:hypothetical protein
MAVNLKLLSLGSKVASFVTQEDKGRSSCQERRMLRRRIWSDHDGILRPGVNFINIINNVETLTRKSN